jgi:hypothetical protein
MSRRIRADLDVRIRRAWPIADDTTSSTPSATQRIRTRIDERIAGGAQPNASHTAAPARRTVGFRGQRHIATVLAGAVVVASVLALGGLVAGRLGLPNRPDDLEFAEEPASGATDEPTAPIPAEPAPGVTDEPTARVPDDPDAHVSTAVAATRRAAAGLTVQEAERQWEDADMRSSPDTDAFVEQSTPSQESTSVRATNGDWSYTDRWNTGGSNTQLPFNCGTQADCPSAVRFVGGRYYERGYNERMWEHVVADDGPALADAVRDALTNESRIGAKVRDGSTVVDLLAPYDAGWEAVPNSGGGATRYRMTDTDTARRLAEELFIGRPLTPSGVRDLEAVTAGETLTVHVWIDDETGLVQRVLTQRSAGEGTAHAWVMRNDITLTQEDGSLVETPEPATDVPLDEWCARDRSPIWRTAAGWTTVCGSQ